MQTAWDFKGTTAKKHEEVIAARRKELQDNPDLTQKKIEDHSRWYKEERVPPWQERLSNKLKGKKNNKKEGDQAEVEGTKLVKEREGTIRSE
jgi:methionyl-tRNA synthetase